MFINLSINYFLLPPANNLVTFLVDLTMLFVVIELWQAFSDLMLKPHREAILCTISDFDARFDEEFKDPLDILTPSAEGELPYLKLDAERHVRGWLNNSTRLRIAYKVDADGGRGAKAGLFMTGGDAKARFNNARYSSVLNTKWGKKVFLLKETSGGVNTLCDGCYSSYGLEKYPPFMLSPEARNEKEQLKRWYHRSSKEYFKNFKLCRRCVTAANDDDDDDDSDRPFTTPAGRTLKWKHRSSDFVSSRDIREGKVVRYSEHVHTEQKEGIKAKMKVIKSVKGGYISFYVFG